MSILPKQTGTPFIFDQFFVFSRKIFTGFFADFCAVSIAVCASLGVVPLTCEFSPAQAAEVNGYVANRLELGRTRTYGLFPTERVPQVLNTLEINVTLKQSFSDNSSLYGDFSGLGKLAGGFVTLDSGGNKVAATPQSSDRRAAWLSLNELYVNHEIVPQFNILAGKKRVSWGAGFAQNPTDIVNPPKSAIDPTAQRKGAWLGQIEAPFEQATLTLLATPEVGEDDNGIPQKIFRFERTAGQGRQAHYLFGARAYALLQEADVSLVAYYTHLYQNMFAHKWRVGASFARFFFKDYEVHFEGLAQRGSLKRTLNGTCVATLSALAQCGLRRDPVFNAPLTDDQKLSGQFVVGGRYQFSDDSLLNIEYLYQADGYTPAEFENFARFLAHLRTFRKVTAASLSLNDSMADVTRAGTLLMRHYLIANYQRYKVSEDVFLGAALLHNFQDTSGLASPQAIWSAQEWLTLTLSGVATYALDSTQGARLDDTQSSRVSEQELFPTEYRASLEMKAFF